MPLVVIGGKEYGTGSSRDWAAKGTFLLGVKAVIAESFERIHRSNLVGMGVLPLVFKEGESRTTLGLTGDETFDILGVEKLHAAHDDGRGDHPRRWHAGEDCRCCAASIPRTRSSTTATAASCTTCCAGWRRRRDAPCAGTELGRGPRGRALWLRAAAPPRCRDQGRDFVIA